MPTNPRVVVFSTYMGLGCCWCPISIKAVLVGMTCLGSKENSAPIAASAAGDISLFKIFAMFSTAPLSLWFSALFDKKKRPSALIFVFGLHRYNASLCTFRIILLVPYVTMASG